MDIKEAIEILEAPFAIFEAHLGATSFVYRNATENQRNLIEKLPRIHQDDAIRSLARIQLAEENLRGTTLTQQFEAALAHAARLEEQYRSACDEIHRLRFIICAYPTSLKE